MIAAMTNAVPPGNNSLLRQATWRWGRIVAGSVISLLLLWLAFRQASAVQLWNRLAAADYRFVALALVCVLLSPLARAARWRLLFHPRQADLPLLSLANILLIGQMLNILIPVRLGELARIHFLARNHKRSRAHILGSLVVEKWLDLVMLLLASMLALMLIPSPAWFRDARLSLAATTAVFLLVALAATRYRGWLVEQLERVTQLLPNRWQDRIRSAATSTLMSLEVLRSPRLGALLIGWSVVLWGLGLLVNQVIMLALGLDLPLTASLLLLVALAVGVMLPSAPANLGVFHFICILTLDLFGVPREAALSYAILLHLVVFLPPVLLGLGGFWWETSGRALGRDVAT